MCLSAPLNSVVEAYWTYWGSLLLKKGLLFYFWGNNDGAPVFLQVVMPQLLVKIVLRFQLGGTTIVLPADSLGFTKL